MSRIDLKAIDGTFLRGLTAFSSGSSGGAGASSSGGSATQVSLGLRVGAQTYAQSLRSFNSLISTVNVSQAALEKLGTLTDEMIGITERATKSFVSDATRRSLDTQLKRVASKFRGVVEDANVGDRDLLSKDGLAEVFALVGLDPENAEGVAAIFKKLESPDKDPVLASEEEKGSRPVNIPRGAFETGSATASWRAQKVSNASGGAAATNGIISQNTAFWTDDDNYNNQNSAGNVTLASASLSGNLSALASGLSHPVELLSVSENIWDMRLSKHRLIS